MKNRSQKKSQHLNSRSLRFEPLEARQMLSVSPLSTDDTFAAPITFDGISDNVASTGSLENSALLSFASQSAPMVKAAGTESINLFAVEEEGATLIYAYAVGSKVEISFDAEPNQDYTIVVTPAVGKPTYKIVKDTSGEGCFYAYSGKVDASYTVEVYKGKFTAATIGTAPEESKIGEDIIVSTLPTPKLSVSKDYPPTENSITFKYDKIADAIDGLHFEGTINGVKKCFGSVDFADGFKTGDDFNLSVYDSYGNDQALTLKIDTVAKTMTISGLSSYQKNSFKISTIKTSTMSNGDEVDSSSVYSNTISLSTTKVPFENVDPASIKVKQNDLKPTSAIDVQWDGVTSKEDNGTPASSYTVVIYQVASEGEEGGIVLGKKAKTVVVKNGATGVTVAGLKDGTKYTAVVYANKTSAFNAGTAATAEETVTTKGILPAAKLKNTALYDDAADVTVTNWIAMKDKGADTLTVSLNGGETVDLKAAEEAEPGDPWVKGDFSFDPTQGVLSIKGLNSSTKYTVTIGSKGADAVSTKLTASSFTTKISAYGEVKDLKYTAISETSVTLSWSQETTEKNSNTAANYTVVATPNDGSKAKTFTVKAANAANAVLTGLKSGVGYTFSVVAKADKKGSSPTATLLDTSVKTTSKITFDPVVYTDRWAVDLAFKTGYDLNEMASFTINFKMSGSGSGSGYSDSAAASDSFTETKNACHLIAITNRWKETAGAEANLTLNSTGGVIDANGWFFDEIADAYGGRGSGNLTITGITATDADGVTYTWTTAAVSPKVSMPSSVTKDPGEEDFA